jgi:type II secretory pathway pseudopilin PulG
LVIVLLGLVAGVAIPRMGRLQESARLGATRSEMQQLKSAILGIPDARGLARGGYETDVGHPPNRLTDLVVRPDSVPPWNAFLRRGWNGPYFDSSGGDYLRDAWDSTYRYDASGRTLTSHGNGSDLVLSF